MKFASLDRLRISVWKLAAFSLLGSAGAALLMWFLVASALGEARAATALVVAALMLYTLLSAPRRILDRERVAQARESLVFSAAAMACLNVTGSRPKTLVLLRPRDATLASSTAEAGRRVLLGDKVEEAVADTSRSLASYSAAAALLNVASMRRTDFEAGDEEARGLASSSELSGETKLPVFMTVCFFSPIMLVLYTVFTHIYDLEVLVELAALEFVALDFTFYLSASDRGAR